MSKNPKLSIIVPVYNAEKYLDRCMSAIYEQTFTDYEIILVNDGSKDDSLKMCRSYAEKDGRIRVVDKENGGAGSARNAGIEVATGEYLAFPDADDWFAKEMYEELYELAKSGDYDIVFSGVHYYNQGENGEMVYASTAVCKPVRFQTKEECRGQVMELFPTTTIFDSPCNKLYKRSILERYNIRFRNLRRCQDAVFNLDFYNCIESAVSTPKAYYNYMQNTQEGVWRKFPKTYYEIIIFYNTHLIELLKEWGAYEGKTKEHYDSSFVIGLYESAGMFDNPNWKLTKAEKLAYVETIFSNEQVREFLESALVREDVEKQLEILRAKDVKRFFKEHKKERFKQKLRQNKVLRKIYRLIKG